MNAQCSEQEVDGSCRKSMRPGQRSASRLRQHAFPLLFVGISMIWLASLTWRALFIPDEGRYAEIAREMLASGDWITPRLNDLKYFEKPPLQYWLTALSYQLFGQSNWSARLAPALLGQGCVAMVCFTAGKIWGSRASLLALLVLSSGWAYFFAGSYLTLDMSLSALLGISLCCFLLARRAQQDGAATRSSSCCWMWVAWLAIGLAFLAKGLIAFVIPGLTLILYTLVPHSFSAAPIRSLAGSFSRKAFIWRQLGLWPGLAILACVILPWLLLVQARNPEFFRFFFIHEQFQRFSTDVHSRTGAWWYYLPVLIVGAMPWTPVLFAWLARLISNSDIADTAARPADPSRLVASDPKPTDLFDHERFCACWVFVVVVFFSLSHSKLPGYILPAFPALALLLTRQLQRASMTCLYWCAGTVAAIGLAGLVGTTWLGHWHRFVELSHGSIGDLYCLYAAAVLLLSGALVACLLLRRKALDTAVAVLALTSMMAWSAVFVFMHAQDGYFSSQRLVRGLTPAGVAFAPQTPFYSLGQFDSSLSFYLSRPLTLVAFRGELGPGIDAQPTRALATVEQFVALWKGASGQAFAVMTPQEHARLASLSLPMILLRQDRRLIIVSRQPTFLAPVLFDQY